jgi:hypothetical protein
MSPISDAVPDPLYPLIADAHEVPGCHLTNALAQETDAEDTPPLLTGVVLATQLLMWRFFNLVGVILLVVVVAHRRRARGRDPVAAR